MAAPECDRPSCPDCGIVYGERPHLPTCSWVLRHVKLPPDAENLLRWWLDTAETDIRKTLPKATEYGSLDLQMVGDALDSLIKAPPYTLKAELGIAFYLLGKVARLISAYEAGREPSDDTWFDITIYSMMARRLREAKKWP